MTKLPRAMRDNLPKCRSLIGAALIMFTCVGTLGVVIDRRVTIQPIRVGLTDGSQIANSSLALWEEETDRIWAQAGVDIQFLPFRTFLDSTYYNISITTGTGGTFFNLLDAPNNQKSSDPFVINLFFVNDISGAQGVGLTGGNGIVVDNGGIGRRDAIAHELGHNLGLDHTTYGAPSDSFNLMIASPAAPPSVDSIKTDGTGYSRLNSQQVTHVRTTAFQPYVIGITPYEYTTVPEPRMATAIASMALGAYAVVRRVRRQSQPDQPKCL